MLNFFLDIASLRKLVISALLFIVVFAHHEVHCQSFLGGYQYRKLITVDGSLISGSGSLNEFPIFFDLTDSDIQSKARSDGFDIAFADTDGTTVLNHDLFDYDNSNGRIRAWVSIDLTGSANRSFYVYYGDASQTTDPSSTNTWNSGFQAVLHLQESGNGTTDEFLDASGNTRHGTGGGLPGAGSNGNTPNQATGKFGFAQDFTEGNNDRIRLQAINDDAWTAVTVQVWVNPDGTGDDRIFGKCWGTGTDDETWLLRQTGGVIGSRTRVNNDAQTGVDDDDNPIAYNTGTWYLASYTWDATDDVIRVYLNGTQVATGSTTDSDNFTISDGGETDFATIGNIPGGGRAFDGQIQEARVSNVARDSDWLTTQYNIENNAASFITTVAMEESALDITFASNVTFLLSPSNTVTFTVSGTDFDGNATFDLQSSTDNVSFSNETGFTNLTSTSFTSPTISADEYFRIVVSNAGAADESFTSSSIFIDVEPAYAFGSYTSRRSISIDETRVYGEDNSPTESSHTNFPILVSFTNNDFRTVANGGKVTNENGFDIIFTDGDASTQLDHDLESYNPSTGEVIAWVKIPSLDTENDDELFIYYGNGAITASQSTTDTWSNGFKGVWHMSEDPSVTRIFDYSGNSNDAVPVALESDDSESAKIGLGIDLDGYNADGGNLGEFLFVGAEDVVPSVLNITSDLLTVTGWIKPSVLNNTQYSIIEKGNNNQDVDISYWLGRDDDEAQARLGTPETAGNGLRLNSTQTLSIGTWAYIALTYDGSAAGNNFILYINGQVGASDARTGNIITDNLDEFFIGGRDDATNRFFDGTIDELRVAEISRSPGWIQTEYQNQCFTSDFITLADERSCPDPVTGGTATATDAAIFIGETTSIVLSGNAGGTNIQWQKSEDDLTYTDIAGETGTQIDVGPLSLTTYYRAKVSNSSCTAYSTVATVEATEAILAGYSFRKCIQINPAQVVDDGDMDNALLNFPVLIDIRNDPDLNSDNVDRNGEFAANNEPFPLDIVFSDASANLLTFEIEEFTFNGTAPNETGSLRAWVLIPSLSTLASTKIFLNYGNCNVTSGATTSVTDNGNSVTNSTNTNTWTNNFVAVWHLEDETSIGDATSNNLDGTIVSGPLINATGQIGDGIDFPGTASSEYIRVGGASSAPASLEGFSAYTLSGWVNATVNNNDKSFIELSNGTNTNAGDLKYFLGLDDDDIQVRASVGTATADQSILDNISIPLQDVNDGTWHYVAVVYDGSELTTYVDGSFAGTSDNTNLDGNINSEADDEFRIGGRNDTRRFDGSVDELRIANSVRGAGWIQTEYNNQLNPIIDIATPANNGNFYTLGDEESFVLWTDNDGGNSNWSDPDNWGICRVPDTDETVRLADPAGIGGSNPTFDPASDEIGGLLIETSGDLTYGAPTNTLTINGNITNNSGGTFAPPGTITMGGTSKQSIQGNDGSTFGALVIDNTAGVDIDALTTINTSLTFTNGFITLTDDTLAIASTGSIINASSLNFIVTPFDNCLIQNVALADGTVLFPLGTSTSSYTPTTINNTGTADDFCIYVANNVYSLGFIGAGTQQTSEAIDKTWFISEQVEGGSNITLTLQWNGVDELTDFDRSDMFISHFVSPNWSPYEEGIAASGADPYVASVSGVTSFSPVGGGSGESPLPVELKEFLATRRDSEIELKWTTLSEINNDLFEVQRSADNLNFEIVGTVNGAGTTSEQQNYNLTDRFPLQGLNFYRLRQVDFDGQFEYSHTVVIDMRSHGSDLLIYPNPSHGEVQLVLTGLRDSEKFLLELLRLDGKTVLTKEFKADSFGQANIPLQLGKTGNSRILLVRIITSEQTLVRKLISRF